MRSTQHLDETARGTAGRSPAAKRLLVRRFVTLGLCLLIGLSAGCRGAGDQGTEDPAELTPTSQTRETPTAQAPPTAQLDTPPPTDSSPAAAAPGTPSDAFQPASSPLLGVEWDDRTPFEANLLPGERPILQQLADAPFYQLDLRIQPDLIGLTANQEVRYVNRTGSAQDALFFRVYADLLGGQFVLLSAAVDNRPVLTTTEAEGSALRVLLPAPLAPGAATTVAFSYSVRVPETAGSNYGILVYDQDILALAHFFPQLAVFDDDGWDLTVPPPLGDVVYAESSFYLVRVTAPDDLVLAVTGAVVAEAVAGDERTSTFAAGPVRDFYLAGSADFVTDERVVNGVRVIGYAPAFLAASNRQVVQNGAAALELMAEWLGPYPYTELEIVTTPTTALGVEYPGIIAMSVRLYDETGSSSPVRESTVAHEVAHQWFYGLVGNDQLDEPWLDESLTQYATMRYYRDRYGAAGELGFRDSLTGRWAAVDNAPIPIGQPVSAYSGIEYGAIIYGRGALFVEALAAQLGPELFDRFLLDYVASQRYGVATTASFERLAESACTCDLDPLFADWIRP